MTARSRTFPTAVVLVACGSLALAAAPALADTAPVRTVGVVSANGAGGAWTYNSAELPSGARMVVTATYPDNGTTIVTLHLTGAAPSREYGAHAHKAGCTAASADALGHFQFVPNPNPLNPTDPAYANSSNEIWLECTPMRPATVARRRSFRGSPRKRVPCQWSSMRRTPALSPAQQAPLGSVGLHDRPVLRSRLAACSLRVCREPRHTSLNGRRQPRCGRLRRWRAVARRPGARGLGRHQPGSPRGSDSATTPACQLASPSSSVSGSLLTGIPHVQCSRCRSSTLSAVGRPHRSAVRQAVPRVGAELLQLDEPVGTCGNGHVAQYGPGGHRDLDHICDFVDGVATLPQAKTTGIGLSGQTGA